MKLHRYRRYLQAASLVLFFGLLTLTVWPLGSVFLGAFLVADPLFAINSAISGSVRWEMALAVVMLAVPLALGRAFCGYACPMGALVEWTSPANRRRGPSWLAKLPVFVLVACAALAVFGSAMFLVFDPLSTLTRSATTLVYPLVDRVLRLAGDVAYLAPPARPAVDTVTTLLAGRLVFPAPRTYGFALGILGMFAAILAASLIEPKLWCRHLCPLGALLGHVGRFSLYGRVVDGDKCDSCGKCRRACPMGAIAKNEAAEPPGRAGTSGRGRPSYQATDTTRCQLGFECADACPKGAISFGRRPVRDNYSPSRRALLSAAGLSLVGGFFVFTSLGRRERNVRLVRPPGAVTEAAFLGLCSRCGQCMKVCPTNVIQPSVAKAGLEGLLTPEMDFRHGYCDFSCNECGKVCPTGAIRRLSLAAKRRTVIGRAYIDRNRCIPWADFKNCIVCQELCPVPDKAVLLTVETVKDPRGRTMTLKRPSVVAERCIGCGICEANCPVPYQAAIEVRGTKAAS